MSENKLTGRQGAPVWGIFIFFAGMVFFLQTVDVFPWGIWKIFWRLWPVIIIIAGLNILLQRYNKWLVSLLILAIFSACLGIAVWQYDAPAPSGNVAGSYTVPLDDIQQANIELRLSGGDFTIDSLPPDSPNLVEVTSELGYTENGMNANFQRRESGGRLYLKTEQDNWPPWQSRNHKWTISFSRNIPLTLNIKSAGSTTVLDLSRLKIPELHLTVDAGNYKITLPAASNTSNMEITTNVTYMEVNIPVGATARIQTGLALGAFITDTTLFPKRGDYYISDNFEESSNRIYLAIHTTVGIVRIK